MEPRGLVLCTLTLGNASIEDVAQTLASKRYIATLVRDVDGWILYVNTPQSSHAPFVSAEATFSWWPERRHALPSSRKVARSREPWPPGIDED
jgi:hypothetical protein